MNRKELVTAAVEVICQVEEYECRNLALIWERHAKAVAEAYLAAANHPRRYGGEPNPHRRRPSAHTRVPGADTRVPGDGCVLVEPHPLAWEVG